MVYNPVHALPSCLSLLLDTGSKSGICSRAVETSICIFHTHSLTGCKLVNVAVYLLQQNILCGMQLSYLFFFFSSLRLFNEEALKDYKRFRKQEVRDLKEVLAAHIKTQIVLCKLVCLI